MKESQQSFIASSPFTKEELAKRLNGRPYGAEMRKEEEAAAARDGLVVVFGASDDLMEFRGAICDEAVCNDGWDILVNRLGPVEGHEDCECQYCSFSPESFETIKAIWDKDGYSWTYKTKIPHATFDIIEDDTKYCRGIVFELADMQCR